MTPENVKRELDQLQREDDLDLLEAVDRIVEDAIRKADEAVGESDKSLARAAAALRAREAQAED
jgi:hypothetical protein